MKEFYTKNKKGIKIGLAVFFIIIIISSIWLFIMPTFKTNKYGNRLKDLDKHKISNKTISEIKSKANENDSVLKISYHREGRIINISMTVDSNFGVDQAKEFANGLLSLFKDEDKSYYDIQVLIKANDKSENYPIIGYKNKNSDSLNFSTGGN